MKTKQTGKDKRRVPNQSGDCPISRSPKSAVLNSLSCPDAQRGYRHAIDEFVDWYCSEPRLSFSKTVVVRYRMHLESRHLAPGTIDLRLGAVRRLAYERVPVRWHAAPRGRQTPSRAGRRPRRGTRPDGRETARHRRSRAGTPRLADVKRPREPGSARGMGRAEPRRTTGAAVDSTPVQPEGSGFVLPARNG